MLHIILMILKVIGFLLLAVLGFLMVALLLVLCAPFRYSIDGKKKEEIYFHARVTWVLFFLRVACSYEKKKWIYYVKLFGYPLISNEETKKKKKRKKGKKARKKEKKKEKKKPLSEEEQLLLSEIEEETKKEPAKPRQEEEKEIKKVTKHKKAEEKPKEMVTKKEEDFKKKKEVYAGKAEVEEKSRKEKKKSPIDLVRGIFEKIKNAICGSLEKIKQFFHRVGELRQKLSEILEKLREWIAFLKEEMTKKALLKLIKILKKLVKHILPRKLRADLILGLEDPQMMGRVLAILGMAMPIYKDRLHVKPYFGTNMVQGEGMVKGKIRLGYLLYLAILVLIDKEIKGTIKKAKAMAKSEKESEGGE